MLALTDNEFSLLGTHASGCHIVEAMLDSAEIRKSQSQQRLYLSLVAHAPRFAEGIYIRDGFWSSYFKEGWKIRLVEALVPQASRMNERYSETAAF